MNQFLSAVVTPVTTCEEVKLYYVYLDSKYFM